MSSALQQLLDHARGPTGRTRPVEFGGKPGVVDELARLLTAMNGFFAFNAGIQVYRAGDPGLGPELQGWNQPGTWKDVYAGLADGLFCFGQDLFGTQFAIEDQRRVVTFNPETAHRTVLGDSLDTWAQWLLNDADVNGVRRFATAWQDEHGPLAPDQRLIPWRFFALGGSHDFTNITIKDAAECMRIRGPIAQTIGRSPDGTVLRLTT